MHSYHSTSFLELVNLLDDGLTGMESVIPGSTDTNITTGVSSDVIVPTSTQDAVRSTSSSDRISI
jgi:hypothetical protein